MGKGRLKAVRDRHQGVNCKLEKQKKLQKEDAKLKKKNDPNKLEGVLLGSNRTQTETEIENQLSGVGRVDTDEEEGGVRLDVEGIDDTDSSEEDGTEADKNDDAEQSQGAEENDIPFSEIDSLASNERGDIIPYQRLTIDNHAALNAALARIELPLSKFLFSAHQSLTSAQPTSIPDVDDDLNRELAFYAQSLAAVKSAQKLIKAEGDSFSRPNDYFAEMVKSDEHMGRVKQRLMDDAATTKAASEARRQRDLKKFGKAVQIAKLQERDKSKRETLEKINTMKRKRSNALPAAESEPDMFDIALESESKRPRMPNKSSKTDFKNPKRAKKDEKYGFGGKKRNSKSNDAFSTSDTREFSHKRMKADTGAKKRPGKARRAKARG